MKNIIFKIYKKLANRLYGTGISKIKFIRTISLYLISKLKPEYIDVFGSRMYLDIMDTSGHSIIEDQVTTEIELIGNKIKKGDVVLDIGANIGFYTLLFAKLVGKEGKVYAFEPEPNNFALLKKTIEYNNLKNVILEQKAVSDKNGTNFLMLSKDIGGHKIINYSTSNSLKVESICLDEYFNNFYGKINFIKIDAEGHEGKIFYGMQKLLKKNQQLHIMTEFYFKLINQSGIKPKQFLELLVNNNFKLYDMREKNDKIVPTTLEKLLQKYDNDSGATDLFCTREVVKV